MAVLHIATATPDPGSSPITASAPAWDRDLSRAPCPGMAAARVTGLRPRPIARQHPVSGTASASPLRGRLPATPATPADFTPSAAGITVRPATAAVTVSAV